MVKINVIKAFRLNLDGQLHEFAAGIHDVEASVAEHWYAKAHSEAVDDRAAADADQAKAVADKAPAEVPAPDAPAADANTSKKK